MEDEFENRFEDKKMLIIAGIVILVLALAITGIVLSRNKKAKAKEERMRKAQAEQMNKPEDKKPEENKPEEKVETKPEEVKPEEHIEESTEEPTRRTEVRQEKPKKRVWIVDRKAQPAIPAKDAVHKTVDFTNGSNLKEHKNDNVTLESKAKYNLDLVSENGKVLKRYTFNEGDSTSNMKAQLEQLKKSNEGASIKSYKVSDPVYRHSWSETVVQAQEGRDAIPEQGHWEYR